ncbi:MAG: cell division protein FtsZ, partial [bacterium]|nr:cell division protein FtsZ [bacterium]
MLEVHEAAKIITESVDPNAKIIFGAIKDEKLKKGDVRVTVIATGFPAVGIAPRGTQLFAFGGRDVKETDVPPLGLSAQAGKIFNTPSAPAHTATTKEKSPPAGGEEKSESPEAKPKKDEDEDEWGAVPSFLRRGKIK